ncbi:MAG: spermidine synthase [Paracoccaceae bacterium]
MRILALATALVLGAVSTASAQGDQIAFRESLYNNVYVFERGDYVIMQFGKNQKFWTESVYDRSEPRALPVTYTRFLTVALAYPEQPRSLLEIGLGGGRTAAYLNLHMPQLDITSVELDPDVIELAIEHFELKPNDTFRIVERDGRIHMVRDRTTHDIILVDAYRGPFVPFHMLTREFYQTAKRRLKTGGVLAQNIEPTTMLFEAAVATLASVFETVELYPSSGNIVAIAYDGPPRDNASLATRAGALQEAHDFYYPLPDLLEDRRILTTVPEAEPLIDDFAPVEMLKSVERHNSGVDGISEPAQ